METTKNTHSSAKYPKRKQFGKCPSFGQTAAHFHSVGSAQPNSLPLSAKTLFQWRQSKSILMRLSITICYFSRIHQFGCVADVTQIRTDCVLFAFPFDAQFASAAFLILHCQFALFRIVLEAQHVSRSEFE
jgi:hypothetical protein